MRNATSRLRRPLPRSTVDALPSVLAQDVGAKTLAAAVDTMLAPVLEALDNLDAYTDPRLAPDDWIDWLVQWQGLPTSDRMSPAATREVLQNTEQFASHLGTAQGTIAFLTAATGVEVTVEDNGGVQWVAGPTSRADDAAVEIQIHGSEADRRIAGDLVAQLVPLGTVWRVL